MQKYDIVSLTALKEYKSKHGMDYTVPENKEIELLFSIYHLGYKTMHDNVQKKYAETMEKYSKSEWLAMVEEVGATLSQITDRNYHILLEDYNISIA